MRKLLKWQMEHLLERPETGMGYQEVLAKSEDFDQRGIVYNAELLLLEADLAKLPKLAVSSFYSAALEEADWAPERMSLTLLPRGSVAKLLVRESSSVAIQKNAGPATDGPVEKTKADEEFKRFCAYPNDRRVNADGSLRPGTYATTAEDAKQVTTGMEAVERYALPNPAPASYRYTITPHAGTVFQQGTVKPAYSHKGGGVEVFFKSGTQPKTVALPPTKLPDR